MLAINTRWLSIPGDGNVRDKKCPGGMSGEELSVHRWKKAAQSEEFSDASDMSFVAWLKTGLRSNCFKAKMKFHADWRSHNLHCLFCIFPCCIALIKCETDRPSCSSSRSARVICLSTFHHFFNFVQQSATVVPFPLIQENDVSVSGHHFVACADRNVL